MCACEVVGVRRCVPEIGKPLGSADELVCVCKGDGKYSCVDCVPPCVCAFFGLIICAWVRVGTHKPLGVWGVGMCVGMCLHTHISPWVCGVGNIPKFYLPDDVEEYFMRWGLPSFKEIRRRTAHHQTSWAIVAINTPYEATQDQRMVI